MHTLLVLDTRLTPTVIALPLHILSSLTLTTPEKRGVAFVFFIASISIAAAVGRFLVLNKRGAYNVDKGGEDQISFDKYYWTVVLAFLEIAAAEIAFVLPALRKVLLDRGRKHGPEKTKAVRVALVEEDEEDDVSVDRTAPEVVV